MYASALTVIVLGSGYSVVFDLESLFALRQVANHEDTYDEQDGKAANEK